MDITIISGYFTAYLSNKLYFIGSCDRTLAAEVEMVVPMIKMIKNLYMKIVSILFFVKMDPTHLYKFYT